MDQSKTLIRPEDTVFRNPFPFLNEGEVKQPAVIGKVDDEVEDEVKDEVEDDVKDEVKDNVEDDVEDEVKDNVEVT